MLGSEKRRPAGIEYGMLNPEGMNSDIRLVKFTPVSTITQARGGDVIRFQIQNDGFFDPYSAYIKIEVECEPNTSEIRFLDRSAHSFINRLVIRSNGVEIERIENYDVIAAMINDMIYSPEQMIQHHWEGFPCQQRRLVDHPQTYFPLAAQYHAGDNDGQLVKFGHLQLKYLREAIHLLYPASSHTDVMDVGEHAFFKGKTLHVNSRMVSSNTQLQFFLGLKEEGMPDEDEDPYKHRAPEADSEFFQRYTDIDEDRLNLQSFPNVGTLGGRTQPLAARETVDANTASLQIPGMTKREFIIPIYSGFLGVLMPSKKFIPLMALPLDIEFTLNPHALYSTNLSTESKRGDRRYVVTRFEIISHVLFFDQEVNLHLENTIANYGLYLHCNSFQLAPVTTISPAPQNVGGAIQQQVGTVPAVIQVGMTHKSINSIHMVFYYNDYETNPTARKLHFVSHNLKRLQVRNGPNYIPSEPITAADPNIGGGDTMRFGHISFLVELLKAWNKLHAPALDSLITAFNYGSDQMGLQNKPLLSVFDVDQRYGKDDDDNSNVAAARANAVAALPNASHIVMQNMLGKQATIGRTQYGINLEGEELGTDKSLITGRAAQTPFDLQVQGSKIEKFTSYCNIYLRHDYIVSIRPDLVIQIGGR